MPYAKVNPSGCTERNGLVQVRLDIFLEPGGIRYDDPRFFQVDWTSKQALAGYQGKRDQLQGRHQPWNTTNRPQ